jgi:predicted RNA binding protein YcfA (HicA-like mRNA interferase family)
MKAISGREFSRILEQHGWELRQIKGSHYVYGKSGSTARISLPIHGNKPLKIDLLKNFLKIAGISEDEI